MARRALGPATAEVVRALEQALAPTDRAGLVACSGGADSLALAAAAALVFRRRGSPVGALVVDHGLQPGSGAIAERARDQLTGLGYADATVARVQVDLAGGSGPEAAARAARYRALDAAATDSDAVLLLGHTLDDQAETVLLGLARGSGPRSLAGMPARTARLLRPLLGLRRASTALACRELGLEPWQDPHNDDEAYARVRVRHRVLPVLEATLGPGVAEALARTASLARDDCDLLDDQAAGLAAYDEDSLDCALLLQTPAALRRRVLRGWLLAHGAAEVTFAHAVAVEGLVTAWHGQAGVDVAGVRVVRSVGRLRCATPGTVAG